MLRDTVEKERSRRGGRKGWEGNNKAEEGGKERRGRGG